MAFILLPQVAEGDARVQVLLPLAERLAKLLLAGLLLGPRRPTGKPHKTGQFGP